MEQHEELEVFPTSDETLSDIRELSIRCRDLLNRLSTDDGPADGTEARDLTASFNIWLANMGVFREGRQSLTSRLKNAPQISELVQQLLVALKRDLEKGIILGDSQEGSSSASESEDSSDRSSTSSYRLLSPSDDDEGPPPRPTVWTSIQHTITGLRQLAVTIRLAGARHRQERMKRFKNLDRNKQVCQLIEKCARQMVDFRFPKASEVLRERMAESIATRRARFLYLEQHQKKTSTLNEPAPALEQKEDDTPAIQSGQQQSAMVLPPQQGNLGPSLQPSVILSTTDVTKLDLKQPQPAQKSAKRAESVSSVKISMGTIPSIPALDTGGTSFTCPYCFLVCPAKEVSGPNQWMSHLIHDFEPFFCVFDDCSSPFTCADTYSGWLAHMRDTHTQPEWHCWHCQTTNSFSSPADLEKHLKKKHQREVADSLLPTVVRHSMVRDQHALHDCPFCGGFPDEIEKDHPDRDSKPAREALEKHVRDHLVSVALILAPVETEEPSAQLDDTQSEAQRGTEGKRDLEGVADTYELECRNDSCDCKKSEKDSVIGWSTAPGHQALEMKEMERVTQLWKDISDKKAIPHIEDKTLLDFAAKFTQNPSPLSQTNPEDRNKQTQRDPRDTSHRDDKGRIEHREGGEFMGVGGFMSWFLPTEADETTRKRFITRLERACKRSALSSENFFLPEGMVSALVTTDIVRQLMPRASDGLVEFVCCHAKKVFLTTLLSRHDKVYAAMSSFYKHGITDVALPIKALMKVHEICKLSIDGECNHRAEWPCFSKWECCEMSSFQKTQWVFYAPIFKENDRPLKLEENHVLPFTSVDEIGRGGHFSTVSRAKIHPDHYRYHSSSNQGAHGEVHVALKHMKDLREPGYNVQTAWESEAGALGQINQLHNKHLVRGMGAFTTSKNYYIMFEWPDGGTLRDVWMRQNVDYAALNGNRIIQVLEQLHGLADALSMLHNKANNKHRHRDPSGPLHRAETILAAPSLDVPKVRLHVDSNNMDSTGEEHWRHGDLKPDNILLFRDATSTWLGTLKIAGLGLEKQHAFATFQRVDPTRQRYSTSHYEAPEVVIRPYEPRSRLYDIWSMGCIIFEFVIWLLYGYPGLQRFYGEQPPTSRDTLYFTVNQREDHAQVSDIVKKWTEHMLRFDPECNGQSPSAIGDLIKLVRDHLLVVTLPGQMGQGGTRQDADFLERSLREIMEKAATNRGGTYLFTRSSRKGVQTPRQRSSHSMGPGEQAGAPNLGGRPKPPSTKQVESSF